MKTIVLDQDVLELEIKPESMILEYRRLIEQEVNARLVTPGGLRRCVCPGCRSDASTRAFDKFGLTYRQCDRCESVFVSPRPPEETLIEFHRSSKAACFWRDHILPESRETRREKLFRPRARWLLDVVDRYLPLARTAIVAGYHSDLLIEEVVRRDENRLRFLVANPVADIDYAEMGLPGVTVSPTPLNELAALGPADIFLAFDILDRCADTDQLFSAARATLAPGGLLLATTTLISGFDLQVLWASAPGIHPPDRLNVLSTEGLAALYERHGFEALELSTPGTFDIEAVRRAIEADPNGDWPRFIRYLVENRDANALDAFQEYLQTHRLSSFARIALRRQ